MEIERIEAYEVRVPARPGTIDSETILPTDRYAGWPNEPIVLLDVIFSDGVHGLGECGRGEPLASFAPALKALPGVCIPGIALTHQAPSRTNTDGKFPHAWWRVPDTLNLAIETAVLDAIGKRLGCRVVDLLGGAYRQTVPVDYWCGRQTPPDLTRTVEKALAGGFRGLKMKSHHDDPLAEQLAAIESIAGPHFRLTIDPMFQWVDMASATNKLAALADTSLAVQIEDPFPQDRPDQWHAWREQCDTPLIWHARTQTSLRQGIAANCADAFNCSGCAAEFLTSAHTCEVVNRPCWHGSAIELGIGQIAQLHAAAAARACILPSDIVSPLVREHTLIDWDWPYDNGHLPLPTGPGLGVLLDHDAVTHYTLQRATFI